ncbi:MAG: sigma-54-dependent Fis family transcriptional regulator [Planctomycetes bacterium]|nr:sigma-54-dependent Fis family transcriptional regulator [Planctomycetota bacterium]
MLERVLAAGLEPEALLDVAIDTLLAETGAERGYLLLTTGEGEGTGGLQVLHARHMDQGEVDSPAFAVSRGLVDRVARSGRPVRVEDAALDPEWAARASVRELALRSVLCAPVVHAGEVIAVAYLEDRREAARFSAADLGLLARFCERVGGLIRGSLGQRRRFLDLEAANQAYRRSLRGLGRKYAFGELLGSSAAMQPVYERLDLLSRSEAGVLIEGESGTGKELAARAIHFNSRRAAAPFQAIACPALSDTVLEAELFGYVRGAFTGADTDRDGLIRQATGGTLFLDDVSGMSPRLQASLLRVLEDAQVRPLGASASQPVDVRVLASTAEDLGSQVEAGRFRGDLYWRLQVVRLRLPPLRERREDIPLLLARFLREAAREQGMTPKEVSADALRRLARHPWPGNVRELRNLAWRFTVLVPHPTIQEEDLSFEEEPQPLAGLADLLRMDYAGAKEGFVQRYLSALLERHRWNVSACAREAGIQRQALQRMIRRLGLQRPAPRPR